MKFNMTPEEYAKAYAAEQAKLTAPLKVGDRITGKKMTRFEWLVVEVMKSRPHAICERRDETGRIAASIVVNVNTMKQVGSACPSSYRRVEAK